MYPAAELNRLAGHREALRRRIAEQRRDCAEALQTLSRPLDWLDRAIVLGRQIAPLARVSLEVLGLAWSCFRSRGEKGAPRHRWLSLLFSGLQAFFRWHASRAR
jgi:hypothetical protein